MSEAKIENITNISEEMNEKPYTFKELTTEHIFPMFKLLNKMGLQDMKDNQNVKNIIFMFSDAKARKALDPSKLGLDIFLELACIITESIQKFESEFYGLLSMTSDLSVEQIKKQSPAVTFEMIVDFVKKEEFGDFFKVATKLFK